MPAATQRQLSRFASDLAEGLFDPAQKRIPPRYFYDALGSSLFEAITLLPEYGLTRADVGLLKRYAREIAHVAGEVTGVAELGSGNGSKARYVLEAFNRTRLRAAYYPVDVSSSALSACKSSVADVADVHPVCGDWIDGLQQIVSRRRDGERFLVLFLGSSIGNLDRDEIPGFLQLVRSLLRPGDSFLLGADLVKDVDVMLAAYDDPTGVTAAFNLNLLGRINRELDADFDLRSFTHEARWNAQERRIEMYLISRLNQTVYIGALETAIELGAGETIWTESSHKFSTDELDGFARAAGFTPMHMWIDEEWPFAEALWSVQNHEL